MKTVIDAIAWLMLCVCVVVGVCVLAMWLLIALIPLLVFGGPFFWSATRLGAVSDRTNLRLFQRRNGGT